MYWDLHSTYISLYVEYVFHQLNLLVTRSVVQIHASLLFICMTLRLSFFMHQIRCFCTLKCQHLSESEGRDDFDQRLLYYLLSKIMQGVFSLHNMIDMS